VPIGRLGTGGTNAMHDCQRLPYASHHDTGSLFPSPYVGDRWSGRTTHGVTTQLMLNQCTDYHSVETLAVKHVPSGTRPPTIPSQMPSPHQQQWQTYRVAQHYTRQLAVPASIQWSNKWTVIMPRSSH